jgi:hypothetical protein
MLYWLPHQTTNATGIPADEILVKRAWRCAVLLGIAPSQVAFKDLTSHFNEDDNGNKLTNQISGRGVFLTRLIDGVQYIGNGNDGFISEGFWIEFGSHGEIRNFVLIWPNLERINHNPTASPQQIIACIRAHKAIVLPNGDEENYFDRLKTLASVKKLTITKITPYYSEGNFGEVPTNDVPPEFVTPIAELEAVADFGNSNATVRLLSPILSPEVSRLLGNKPK